MGAVRAGLAAAADPSRAEGMRAYMKSAMPYRGVMSGPLAKVVKESLAAHPLPGLESWTAAVLQLWEGAAFREERYAALGVLGHPSFAGHRTLERLPLYRRLIVEGAWWDLVDGIATQRLRELLEAEPRKMSEVLRRWSRDPDLWIRRSAVIAQVGRRASTDRQLLYDCIEPNLSDRSFWLRKAIGWALRDYAWAEPEEVARYEAANRSRLSGLSRREALKNAGKPSRRSPTR